MSLSEQNFWSKAAAATVAHSIILPLPPHTSTTDSAPFHRELIQYVDHVLARQKEMGEWLEEKRDRSRMEWFGTVSDSGHTKLANMQSSASSSQRLGTGKRLEFIIFTVS
jgi:hypothetical protein